MKFKNIKENDIVETNNGIGVVKEVYGYGARINIPMSQRRNKGWCPFYKKHELVRKIGKITRFK